MNVRMLAYNACVYVYSTDSIHHLKDHTRHLENIQNERCGQHEQRPNYVAAEIAVTKT